MIRLLDRLPATLRGLGNVLSLMRPKRAHAPAPVEAPRLAAIRALNRRVEASLREFQERYDAQLPALGLKRKACTGPVFRFHANVPAHGSHLVLFFHGFSGSPCHWDPVIDRIFALGFNVVALPMPGHGLERIGAPGGDDTSLVPFSLAEYKKWAEQLYALARQAGQVSLVGFSWGASVAELLGLSVLSSPDPGVRASLRQIVGLNPFVAHSGRYALAPMLRLSFPKATLDTFTCSLLERGGRFLGPLAHKKVRLRKTAEVSMFHVVELEKLGPLVRGGQELDARAQELRALPRHVLILSDLDEYADPVAGARFAKGSGATVHDLEDAPHNVLLRDEASLTKVGTLVAETLDVPETTPSGLSATG